MKLFTKGILLLFMFCGSSQANEIIEDNIQKYQKATLSVTSFLSAKSYLNLGNYTMTKILLKESVDNAIPEIALKHIPEAYYLLGVLYAEGKGVEVNLPEAVNYYQKSALLGYANAQYNLGTSYDFGKGIKQNDLLALKWFNEAAAQGHKAAAQRVDVLTTRIEDKK